MKRTVDSIRGMKAGGERIAVITGYDSRDRELLDSAGVDVILVGDSIGNVRLGYPDTTHVTLEDMMKAAADVTSEKANALVVVDMPIHTYDTFEDAVKNAKRLVDAGGEAVKLEGGSEVADMVKAIVDSGVDVMGHIAHTPQTEKKHRIKGRDEEDAGKLIGDARALEEAGAFAIVIELADPEVAGRVTESVGVPTIGIGAGPRTDGQVLVLDDLVGWTDFSRFPGGRKPRFIGEWDTSSPEKAVGDFINKVKERAFPSEMECYSVYKG
ncbi:MAG: 3-methyl-2-oxobutanoate hydroxymethyltransferase [Candidatus Altiarchaeales archaeon]|nr:3-methyl-2-oxobutanoate hydroxymethyltransferase [Candidatus Altiarchaeales archaeon]MBD3416028.1 3-methyl-2-oxobutanoate hydroxymethyltransferase [Candidatus Altiarchaeales archaeon]